MLEVCRRALERGGYDFRIAESGKLALELLRDAPADVVICDIHMPDMDGLELIRELRRQWPASKLIAISGWGSYFNSFLPIAKKLGAVEILDKPFTLDHLLTAVRSVLGEA